METVFLVIIENIMSVCLILKENLMEIRTKSIERDKMARKTHIESLLL